MTKSPSVSETSLGRIYTLAEAAEYLRMSPKMVAKVARRESLASVASREFLFSESDMLAIWDSLRIPPSAATLEKRRIAALIEDLDSENLRAHGLKQRKKRKEKRLRPAP